MAVVTVAWANGNEDEKRGKGMGIDFLLTKVKK